MNFYTSNSSKLKLFAALATFIILMLSLNTALNSYAARKTTQYSWIENKLSKSKHFNLLGQHNLDYVFIGSSRTIFNISTEVFRQNGLDIYNFGVSGMVLTDYPHFVHEAIKAKPKAIILNMSVQQLYQSSMQDDFKEITTTDLSYIYKTQPWNIKRDATLSYIQHWHSLLVYAEAIYIRTKQVLKRFTIVITPSGHQNDVGKEKLELFHNVDCKVFDKNIVSEHKTVLKCTNGDGVLLGNYIEEGYQVEQNPLLSLNPNYIRLLNAIIDTIKSYNIKPIVVLEPVLNHKFSYNFVHIEKNLKDAHIYDLTSMYGVKEYWADASHFNHKGQIYYSAKLSELLSTNNR